MKRRGLVKVSPQLYADTEVMTLIRGEFEVIQEKHIEDWPMPSYYLLTLESVLFAECDEDNPAPYYDINMSTSADGKISVTGVTKIPAYYA